MKTIKLNEIELKEIENLLLKHDVVQETAVIAREDKPGEKNLCAYIVSETKIDVSDFREYLASDLPGYMIPSYFVQLERMPLTPNCKLDRGALPAPGLKKEKRYIPPSGCIEGSVHRG